MSKNAKKAGNWVVEYGKSDISSRHSSIWWRIKYKLLNFTVSWIPIRYLKYMARSALQDMLDKAREERKRRQARAERREERAEGSSSNKP